ncbi:hypothetical protein ABPG72_004270 [Tetrahymena utriculariae]
MVDSKIKIPVIVSDIDGVLVQVQQQLPFVKSTLEAITQPLNKIDSIKFNIQDNQQIPFLLLTNRGGVTEKENAEELNNIFDFTQNSNFKFTEKQSLICHSAVKQLWKTEYSDKLVLVVGNGCDDILKEEGSKYITADEYLNVYPELVPMSQRGNKYQSLKAVMDRLNMTSEEIYADYLQIHAVFIIQNSINWEDSIQLIIDLLTTCDGKIAHEFPKQKLDKHIPIYSTVNDIMYKDHFRLARLDNKIFISSLQSAYKLIFNDNLKIITYGKPSLHQFEYAYSHIINNFIHDGIEISNVYMIGDNPHTDIQGANIAGWTSILVRTGIFVGSEENDKENPAKYVVDNFKEAIKLIFSLENISTNLLD